MNGYSIRILPLGGVVGVTKNMYVYELYKDSELTDIILIDCGIGFPKEQDLGIDLEIPDIEYLKNKTHLIRALLFTHGHEDHIGATKFLYDQLGRPKIYASLLTASFLSHKFKEFEIKADIQVAEYNRNYIFGEISARFVRMTHSIPDTTQIILNTPVGVFYHGSDFKIDLTPPYGPGPDFFEIAKAGKEGVLCMLTDSLGADREGFTASESVVGKAFEDEIRMTKGKFIMSTFGSNISRVRQCAEAAMKFNRKICLLGRSMREAVRQAADIGYFPIPKKFMISEKQVAGLKPNHVCIIATGSQAQMGSALVKLSSGDNKYISIEKGDKVLFSSDPIPGNEEGVFELIERLYLLGAEVQYAGAREQLHASGHGSQEDLKLLARLVNPRYIMPIGGTIRHQRHYLGLAREMGYKDDAVLMLQEGDTMVFTQGKAHKGHKVETKSIYIDSYGNDDVGELVLRDRRTLSKEGIVFVVLQLNSAHQLLAPPELISRGFMTGTERDALFGQASKLVAELYSRSQVPPLRPEIVGILEKFFMKSTKREPLVCLQVIQS